jgi:hypothetical protein
MVLYSAMSLPSCNHCGAPRDAGVLVCRFCRSPHSRDAAEKGVPCPNCGLLHERSAQKCAACATWLVVQCVFCGTLSPHRDTNCSKCREQFAGSAERLAQKRQEQESRRQLELASNVGGVAVSVLGAIAGTGIVGQVANAIRSDDDDSSRNDRSGSGGGFFESLLEDNDRSDDGN